MAIDSELLDSFRKDFTDYLIDTEIVCVDNFYEKLKIKNDLISWTKVENLKKLNFLDVTEKCDSNELEVLAEGYKCLCQIYINLLRDFEIFKTFPIRKYSGAYQYISKINSFREILIELGYKDNTDQLQICFDSTLTEIRNRNDAIETAVHLLICFIEVSELIKLRYNECKTKDLIERRENDIKRHIEDKKYSKMTDENLSELFSKCELCSGEMDMDNGVCGECHHPVVEFSLAPRFAEFIEKQFKVVVNNKLLKEEINLNKFNENEKLNSESVTKESSRNKNTNDKNTMNWECTICTYVNAIQNMQCEVCLNNK